MISVDENYVELSVAVFCKKLIARKSVRSAAFRIDSYFVSCNNRIKTFISVTPDLQVIFASPSRAKKINDGDSVEIRLAPVNLEISIVAVFRPDQLRSLRLLRSLMYPMEQSDQHGRETALNEGTNPSRVDRKTGRGTHPIFDSVLLCSQSSSPFFGSPRFGVA